MLDIYCFLLNTITSQYIIMNLYHIKFVYYLCTYNNNRILNYNYTYYDIEQLHKNILMLFSKLKCYVIFKIKASYIGCE